MTEPAAKRAKIDEKGDGAPSSSPPHAAAAAENGTSPSTASPAGRRRRKSLSPRPSGHATAGKATGSAQAGPAQAAAAAADDAAGRNAGVSAAAVAPKSPAAATAAQQPAQQQQQQRQQQQQQQQQQPKQQQAQVQQKQQQQQQPRQQQQQQQQENGKGGKKGKGKKQWRPYLGTFHQSVKRELPYEAVHVYQKIKGAEDGKLDLALCNGLLNVAVGNWQWELNQRHQHLVRQYEAQGKDTAPLQAAFDTYLAAERERVQQQTQQQGEEGQDDGIDLAADPEIPEGTPAAMVCHIMRAAADRSLKPEHLHSRVDMPDPQVFNDMPQQHKPFTQLMSDVQQLVLSDLQAAGVKPDEQLLVGLARVAGIMGDADKAFEYAQQVVAGAGIPRLRDFHPALVGYALAGNAEKAGEVIRCTMEHCKPGDLTEAEFALWLEAIAAGGTYEQLREALQLMAHELNQLKPRTLALVQRFFESDRAAAALAPGGAVGTDVPSQWQQQWVVNEASGQVQEAGATLSLVDLSESDWQLFDDQVFKLGSAQDSAPGQFGRFRDWLDKHGPFDLTLDGANLAFWGENYAEGGFKCWKVKVAHDHMQALYPEAKILVILHEARVYQTRKEDEETTAWLNELRQKNRLYVTPRNMNDDMFWMYAPIRGRAGARLVSHDQMRDHVWSMLRPKHMLKWRQRHVIDYSFNFYKTEFYPLEPKPYTPCVQEVRPGVWLLPSAERVLDAKTGKVQSDRDKWLLCQHKPV